MLELIMLNPGPKRSAGGRRAHARRIGKLLKRRAKVMAKRPRTKLGQAHRSFMTSALKRFGGGRSAMRKAAALWRQRRSGRSRIAANPSPVSNSWPGQTVRHAKAARKGWRRRTRSNSWTGHTAGHRKAAGLGWRRRSRGVKGYSGMRFPVRPNGILPYMAFNAPRHGGRRRVRRNGILPFMAYNPTIAAPLEGLTNVQFWTGTVLPAAGGFIGTAAVSGLARTALSVQPGLLTHATNIGSSVAVGIVSGLLSGSKDIGAKMFAGGLVYSVVQIVKDVVGDAMLGTKSMKDVLGLSDLPAGAAELAAEVKQRVSEGIRQQLNSGGHVGDYLTTQALQTAPRFGDYLTTQALQTAPRFSNGNGQASPALADLSDVMDANADCDLV